MRVRSATVLPPIAASMEEVQRLRERMERKVDELLAEAEAGERG